MEDLTKLFKKINKRYCIINDNFFYHLHDYIFFLKDDKYYNKYDEILNHIKLNNYFDKDPFFLNGFLLDNDEKSKLLSLFIIKSVTKSNITRSSKEINFILNDTVLNDIIDIIDKFTIFYIRKKNNIDDYINIRKNLFKILKVLALNNIIESKTSRDGIKTQEYWSLGLIDLIISDNSYILINNKPFDLVDIEDNYYLIGDIFYMIQKIFIENKRSNYTFMLNDKIYIEKMAKNPIYLNINDLNNVINTLNEKNITQGSIEKYIDDSNKKIILNSIILDKEKKKIKKNILIKSNKILEDTLLDMNIQKDFLYTKKKLIDIFNDFIFKSINLELDDYKKILLLQILYKEFIYNFKGAKARIIIDKGKKIDEFKEIMIDYGINCDEFVKLFDKFKPVDYEIKKEVELDSTNISFLKYLIIYSKKEVSFLIKKSLKKINKCESHELPIFNLNCIEKNEDKNISNEDILFFILKYGTKYNIDQLKDSIQKCYEIKNENKMIMAEISKQKHLYDLFILKNYCTYRMGDKIDNYGNIKIFFMFYFDFRGRFYYTSSISPTNNRFCRLIFNYGVIRKGDIMEFKSDITITNSIKNNIQEIDDIIDFMSINDRSFFVRSSIFWILISIGKLLINKSKREIKLKEFIELGVSNIKNNTLTDILDISEFKFYLEILKNLRDNNIIRRPLLKDATASFFQNLVRILGSVDDETLKMSNLLSNDTWYDWYSFTLENFFNENCINEESKKYFNRKNIKKIVMTIPYSASFITSLEYFRKNLLENSNYQLKKDDNVYKDFKKFYNFQKKSIENNKNFVTAVSSLKKQFKDVIERGEMIEIIHRNKNGIKLTYFKTKTKNFDLIVNHNGSRKRIVKSYTTLMDEIDSNKTMMALSANLVHCTDALLIQDINWEIYREFYMFFITVHDCFLVDFTLMNKFIEISNNEINKDILLNSKTTKKKEFKSIFVFL